MNISNRIRFHIRSNINIRILMYMNLIIIILIRIRMINCMRINRIRNKMRHSAASWVALASSIARRMVAVAARTAGVPKSPVFASACAPTTRSGAAVSFAPPTACAPRRASRRLDS